MVFLWESETILPSALDGKSLPKRETKAKCGKKEVELIQLCERADMCFMARKPAF